MDGKYPAVFFRGPSKSKPSVPTVAHISSAAGYNRGQVADHSGDRRFRDNGPRWKKLLFRQKTWAKRFAF